MVSSSGLIPSADFPCLASEAVLAEFPPTSHPLTVSFVSEAHPVGDNDCRSGLVQPERVEPDHVVDAEIIFRIVALHVVVPDIEDVLPATGTNGGSCSMRSSACRISAIRLPESTSTSI